MNQEMIDMLSKSEDIIFNEVNKSRKESICEFCGQTILKGKSKFNIDFYYYEYSHCNSCINCGNKLQKLKKIKQNLK